MTIVLGVSVPVLLPVRIALALLLLAAASVDPAGAQVPPAGGAGAGAPGPVSTLSLEGAVGAALEASESVQIAHADITRAELAREQAASQRWPQVFASASYTRTLRSQFQGLRGDGGDAPPPELPPGGCGTFLPEPSQPLEARVRELERAVRCNEIAGPGFGSLVEDLPFGRANQWSFGLAVSQPLYTGGRIPAQIEAAAELRQRATINAASARAQLTLDVAQAYYDALLGDRLVDIAGATIDQAQQTLQQTVAMRKVGTLPEFDVLRARVALQGLRPTLIQQQAARDLAYMRLKQLLDLPLETTLTLTTRLDDGFEQLPVQPVGAFATPEPDVRAPVREALNTVQADRLSVEIAQAQRYPSVSLTARFAQLAYPSQIVPTGNFVSDWTVGFSVDVPVFTGGRIRAEIADARTALQQAELRLAQVRELAALDTADALLNLQAALAALDASSGTVTEAGQAYRIAQIRFREGLSTQVELSDAQLLLQQARVNRAVAERDVRLARLRLELLPELPLGMSPEAIQPRQPTPPRQTAPAPVPESTPSSPMRAAGAGAGGAGAAAGPLQTSIQR